MEPIEYSKFTAETSGREKITVEFPHTDISVSDVCQAFRTMMVGLTFTDESAGEMIASYLEEYYGELFDVTKIKKNNHDCKNNIQK